MAQDHWQNDERGGRRDWRGAGDWHRAGTADREARGGARDQQGYPDRDRSSDGGYDERRARRDGAYRGPSDAPPRPDDDWFGSSYDTPVGRPGGTYGPPEGAGSGYDDRAGFWGRNNGLGWQGRDERRSRSGHGAERSFWDRASDEFAAWFGDRNAERRREEDQFRGRGPKGYTRSDERIREDVSDRLTEDPGVDASDIEVSVSGGEVTLTGTVVSRSQRRRAEDCVEYVSGVTYIQNNIRVKEPAGTPGSLGQTAFGRDASATSETGDLGDRQNGR